MTAEAKIMWAIKNGDGDIVSVRPWYSDEDAEQEQKILDTKRGYNMVRVSVSEVPQ